MTVTPTCFSMWLCRPKRRASATSTASSRRGAFGERPVRSRSSATVEADGTTRARVEALCEELHAIDRANAAYWRCKDYTREAIAEYHRRLERLYEIRSELAQLKA